MLLKEFLEPLGISISDFAAAIGVSRVRLSEIINGRRGVSADTALRLAKALGTSAELWMGLQVGYDLAVSSKSARLGAIKRVRPLARRSRARAAAAERDGGAAGDHGAGWS
jgi:addiction module HigA family antidote